MAFSTSTPADLAIHKRDWKFGRGAAARRWWHGGDPGRTAFFNALSSTFPVGEKFFMTAVRHYRNGAPAPLRSEEPTSELQSLMRISYAVFCLKKKKKIRKHRMDTDRTTSKIDNKK